MAAQFVANTGVRFFYAEVQKFHLRPIKKLQFQFDPFHSNANTMRDLAFHLSSKKIRKTGESCVVKTEIVCDRSEPTINIDLHNGMNVLFKCANLTSLEIAKEFNKIIERFDIKEEKPVVKLKGTDLKKKRKK